MIKIDKWATILATRHKIKTNEIIGEPLKRKSMKLLELPKNTLRVTLIGKVSGYNNDDFVRDIKTVIFTYEIITFKR